MCHSALGCSSVAKDRGQVVQANSINPEKCINLFVSKDWCGTISKNLGLLLYIIKNTKHINTNALLGMVIILYYPDRGCFILKKNV